MKKLISILTLSLISGCGDNIDDSSNNLKKFEVPASHHDYAILGQAFHSDQRQFLNVPCVSGELATMYGNTESRFKLEQDLTFPEIVRRLNGELSVDIEFPLVKAGPEAKYASETAANEFANNFHFSWHVTPKKDLLLPGTYQLTEWGRAFAKSYKNRLLDYCGNEFITAIEYGASLNVNLRVEYRNQKDKFEIGGKIKVKAPVSTPLEQVEVDGKLKYLSDEVKKSVKITVQAIQRGGNPLELSKLIPDNLMTCSLDQPKPCFDVFTSAIKYAKEQLPKQLSEPENYNVMKYYTERYDESGVHELVSSTYPSLDLLVDLARSELDEKFQEALMDQNRATKLLNAYSEWLGEEDRKEISEIRERAKDNARLYTKAAIRCYESPYEGCLGFVDSTEQAIKPYDRKKLSLDGTDVQKYFRCENARMTAVEQGLVSARFAVGYQEKGWAPMFYDNGNPSEGINSWGPCEKALETYGDYFR